MNITAFLIGISSAFFTIFAAHILFWRTNKTRFQTVLGIIMAIWAVWCAKDLVLTFPDMYKDSVLNWIIIIDGWSAITYMVFLLEVVTPGWTTPRKLMLQVLPFLLFTLAYAIRPCDKVIYAYYIFLWHYAWLIVFYGYKKSKRYLNYIRKNYSNIDDIDVSWLKPVFVFSIVSQLSWLFASMYSTIMVDIIYYISAIIMWLLVLYYSWNFRPIVLEIEPASVNSSKHPSLPLGKLELLVEEQQMYLNPNLTLQDLAHSLYTNRTYVSNYLSQQLGKTFYDYINDLRIEKKSIPMMEEHPEYTYEFIATESGFASISTFRRAFIKKTGLTPRAFFHKLSTGNPPSC